MGFALLPIFIVFLEYRPLLLKYFQLLLTVANPSLPNLLIQHQFITRLFPKKGFSLLFEAHVDPLLDLWPIIFSITFVNDDVVLGGIERVLKARF